MKTAGKLSMVVAACSLLLLTFGVGTACADFGLKSFSASYQEPFDATPPQADEAGTKPPATQAGSHADSVTAFEFNTEDIGHIIPQGSVRDIQVDLPAGFYGNPEALPFCTTAYLTDHDGMCDPAAQVGVLSFAFMAGIPEFELPVYNMERTTDETAVLAAEAFGSLIRINISARTDGDYGLRASIDNINEGVGLLANKLTIWGVPADESNDWLRYRDGINGIKVPAGVEPVPFLTAPARCDAPLTTTIYADSWQNTGRRNPDRTPDLSDPAWVTRTHTLPPLTGCDALDFSPSLTARPTTNAADSPSGLDVDLHVPQNFDPEGLSSAQLRTSVVTLPEGLVINPSGANGLDSCDPAEIGLTTAVGDQHPHFNKLPAACPPASRIGRVEVDTPVFPDPLKGWIYAATPGQNPFGNLLTIYAVAEGRGLVIKLPGKVTPDPETGRLTTVFDENPQLTFEDFKLFFFGGAFGVLRTPPTCGPYSTNSTMTPWSAPDTGPPVTYADSYEISKGPGNGCATSKAALPNSSSFEAGSMAALAGKYRPFVVNLRRDDGTQEFSEVTVTPPPGLVAKLAGTQMCPDAALAAAAGKTGAQEQGSPSCPASSEVGSVFAAAGAGPAPYNTPGKAYLAGPYKGAPLSLAIVTPAVAGPYDLGTIVVRTALHIDPATAKITAKSDPIPRILKGIPLDIRSVSIRLDRPDFTLNPTSCDPTEVSASLLSTQGSSSSLSNRFQLAECGRLKFKPSLRLSLKGGTKRTGYPALTAVLKNRAGDANSASIQVALPHSEFLAQEHIGTLCTRVQWAADACPAASVYGKVKVDTPLLDYPLTGNVYLRSSDNPLPDLVTDLRGPAFQPIRFEAAGRIDSVKGGLRTTFSLVPDVPFTKLTLQMRGGKKGLLVNSENICASTHRAVVKYAAHNGLTYAERPKLKAKCPKKKGKSKHRNHRNHSGKH
jgi:hypothetical protein